MQLLVLIIFLLVEVLLPPQISILAVLYRFAMRRLLLHKHTATLMVHPYSSTGLLFVSVGKYEEKISYANK